MTSLSCTPLTKTLPSPLPANECLELRVWFVFTALSLLPDSSAYINLKPNLQSPEAFPSQVSQINNSQVKNLKSQLLQELESASNNTFQRLLICWFIKQVLNSGGGESPRESGQLRITSLICFTSCLWTKEVLNWKRNSLQELEWMVRLLRSEQKPQIPDGPDKTLI